MSAVLRCTRVGLADRGACVSLPPNSSPAGALARLIIRQTERKHNRKNLLILQGGSFGALRVARRTLFDQRPIARSDGFESYRRSYSDTIWTNDSQPTWRSTPSELIRESSPGNCAVCRCSCLTLLPAQRIWVGTAEDAKDLDLLKR